MIDGGDGAPPPRVVAGAGSAVTRACSVGAYGGGGFAVTVFGAFAGGGPRGCCDGGGPGGGRTDPIEGAVLPASPGGGAEELLGSPGPDGLDAPLAEPRSCLSSRNRSGLKKLFGSGGGPQTGFGEGGTLGGGGGGSGAPGLAPPRPEALASPPRCWRPHPRTSPALHPRCPPPPRPRVASACGPRAPDPALSLPRHRGFEVGAPSRSRRRHAGRSVGGRFPGKNRDRGEPVVSPADSSHRTM